MWCNFFGDGDWSLSRGNHREGPRVHSYWALDRHVCKSHDSHRKGGASRKSCGAIQTGVCRGKDSAHILYTSREPRHVSAVIFAFFRATTHEQQILGLSSSCFVSWPFPKSDHKDDDVTPLIIASHRGNNCDARIQLCAAQKNWEKPFFTFFLCRERASLSRNPPVLCRQADRDCLAHAEERHRCLFPLQAGADPNRAKRDGTTPLSVAAHHCHLRVVQMLCTAKADMDKPMAGGLTPLIVAAHGGQVGGSHSQTSMILLAAVLVTRLAELCPVCLVHHLCFVLARDLVSW